MTVDEARATLHDAGKIIDSYGHDRSEELAALLNGLAEIEAAIAWRETWLAEYWPIGANRLRIKVIDVDGNVIAFGEGDTELQALLDAYRARTEACQ